MPENQSPALGFVHLINQTVATTVVTDECLTQTFARLAGTTVKDNNTSCRLKRVPGMPAAEGNCRRVLPSVPTGCVRVRVILQPSSLQPSSTSRMAANVQKLGEELTDEAELLAGRFSAMRRAR